MVEEKKISRKLKQLSDIIKEILLDHNEKRNGESNEMNRKEIVAIRTLLSYETFPGTFDHFR